LGKIVKAYNSGQCEINAEHAWESGDNIYWDKQTNGKTIVCTKKACFDAQGGICKDTIKNEKSSKHEPETPTFLNKHTNQKESKQGPMDELENIEDDSQIPALHAKSKDVVDLAAKPLLAKYITYAKEIKLIEEAINTVFPDVRGEERGMKTKLMWDAEHGRH